ncbi:cyclic AMP-responsive element-binding protein-like isoform X1 [Hydractinia symbiolongicarpus]|uniref:cyclic AMP-responsive element-binding protein-like isoform X1 n=1 Tax=Hydractinia symbiolongicarpus TaxID=13093 RepID=UPI00254F1DE8|nr:cyclic AMP-responsive element-binding protein-like isoform X1 [Hydractinia symbiolongicarpus]XP_057294225.1 cyclic AMP-responsive element-binding protein-like isoform X1 [Hydractinia symbiolongicarpus]
MDVAQHTFQAPLAVPPISSGVDKTPMLQQQSVIQSNQQLQQQLQSMHDSEDRDGHKRREILTRRPSYRKILDDLSVEGPVKMENYEDNGSSNASSPSTDENSINEKQYQSMQLNGVVPQQGVGPNNVVQYSENQPADNAQYIITTQGPGNKIQAYTIKGQLPVGLDSTSIASPQQLAEEANRKRELRLYKNREAARECRRKKKEYVKCLENRVAVLENQNKALIEELKSLKDLYCSKEN